MRSYSFSNATRCIISTKNVQEIGLKSKQTALFADKNLKMKSFTLGVTVYP